MPAAPHSKVDTALVGIKGVTSVWIRTSGVAWLPTTLAGIIDGLIEQHSVLVDFNTEWSRQMKRNLDGLRVIIEVIEPMVLWCGSEQRHVVVLIRLDGPAPEQLVGVG